MQYLALLLITAFALSGCTHFHRVGDSQPNGVKVSIGSKEVAVGDRVEIFKMKCYVKKAGPRESQQVCDKTPVGEGTVTEVLGEKTSIVTPDEGVEVTSEMYAESKDKK